VQVPRDRFPFAVFVRREIQTVGPLEGFFQFGDLFFLVRRDDVDRFEIVVDVDAEVRPGLFLVFLGDVLGPSGKIADVPDAGFDLVTAAQKLRNRAGFGG
jgi:hypothetical protein